jgi:hypothetical protein
LSAKSTDVNVDVEEKETILCLLIGGDGLLTVRCSPRSSQWYQYGVLGIALKACVQSAVCVSGSTGDDREQRTE